MPADYWLRQTPDKPLFESLLWSRPENRAYAGKLMIAGGNLQGFAVPAEAYGYAMQAGIGNTRVILPDALQKTVGWAFEAGEFAPSTPSGSFGRAALGEFIACAQWADGVLLAGEFGRNSETAILLESFVEKYSQQLTITRDAVDYFTATPLQVLARPETTLVLSLAQLQKMIINISWTTPITFSMDLLQLVDALHGLTAHYQANIIVKHLETILIASSGQVVTHRPVKDSKIWRVATAAPAAVWWLQNPSKTLEGLATSLIHE